MTAIAPATVRAAYQDLCARLDGGVGLILGCCGVIADWAGRTEMFEETRRFCRKHSKNSVTRRSSAPARLVRKHWTAWQRRKLLASGRRWKRLDCRKMRWMRRVMVALHDSCGARGDADTQDAIRRLAEKLRM